MASILTLTTSSQGLLTTASKSGGGYAYNFATVPFLAESLKLLISCYLLQNQKQQTPELARVTSKLSTVLLFPIPSIIYWAHNNVQFFTLQYVDPATYQILGNLKIVTTGLLFWLCLRRRLTVLQWIALTLLMVGATTSQLKTGCDGGGSTFAAPVQGYAFGVLSAFLSALAAVYTEWVMKRNNDSLYWQNIQLYAFGVLFNGLGLTVADIRVGFSNGFWVGSMLRGYNVITFLVVANLAFSGLLVSWVMKFADSIMKVYATSMAMLVTMVVSVLLFGLAPSLQLVLGILTASISLVLYYLNPGVLAAAPEVKMSPPTRTQLPR
ncbi:hypothetical protein WJX72_008374 [[Myrmecia] bisecta]|uniref:CMP-sialic acid transporter n=1 Tax=[Myrmecia] bisecta TaxID=41462 RepID=A0AAW1PA12_9CHLO